MRTSLIILFVFALVASACAGGSAAAATVNGVSIGLDEVESLAPGNGTVDRDTFSNNLRNLIIEQVVLQAAQQDLGVTLDQSAVDARYDEIVAGLPTDLDTYLSDNQITEGTLRHVAVQQVIGEAINGELANTVGEISEEDIQQAYDNELHTLTTVCVHHILVDTEEEANTAKQRIADGESFEDVAKEVSTDTASGEQGGDLGCNQAAAYVPTFAQATIDAPVGELYGPVQTDFGYHILRVDSRETTPLEDVRADIVDQLTQERGQQAFTDWIVNVIGQADIQVDPKYGTWVGDPQFTVLPPAA